MTVNSTDSTAEFVTNGVTTNFPFYFKFFANEDLVVTYVDPLGVSSILTLGTQYTVNGAGNDDGGSVVTTTALAGPGHLAVSREMAAYQQTSLRNQGKFLAEVHEDVFDRLTMLIQQGFSLFKRALVRPLGRDYFFAEDRRIANVKDPVELQDAATKISVETFVASVLATGQGPVNNAANVIYARPDGQVRTVQGLSGVDGAEFVGYGGSNVGAALSSLEGRASALEFTKYTTVVDATVSRLFSLGDAYKLLRLTGAAAKTYTMPAQATVAWPAESEVRLFNDSPTALSIGLSAGVTVKVAYGGALVIPVGGFAWLKRLSADVWLLVSKELILKNFASLRAFGDSNTVGTGASAARFAYIPKESEAIKTPVNNAAVGGACTWDQSQTIIAGSVAVNEASQLMIGTNDARAYLATANNLDTFASSHAALLIWLGVSSAGKVLASDPVIAYTGTWTAGSAYGGTWIRQTSVTGATLTFTFTGPAVYFCATRFVGYNSGANVTVDGVAKSPLRTLGYSANTPNGAVYGPALYRIGGLTNTTHTVVITTTTTSPTNPFFFDWFTTPAAFNRPVNVLNLPRQVGTPATDAIILAYNNAIRDNVNTFNLDGGKFALCDLAAVINPATDLAGDGLHLNDNGHAKAATVAASGFTLLASS